MREAKAAAVTLEYIVVFYSTGFDEIRLLSVYKDYYNYIIIIIILNLMMVLFYWFEVNFLPQGQP